MSRLLTALALACFAVANVHAADKPLSQPEKMKLCSKAATGKKGDERRQFMSACLKKGSDIAALTGTKSASASKRPTGKSAGNKGS